jgi:hypothetical protein
MKLTVQNAKLGHDEEIQALKRLDEQPRRLEPTARRPSLETFAAIKRSVADAGWPVRIRMGKRSDATESGGRGRQLSLRL